MTISCNFDSFRNHIFVSQHDFCLANVTLFFITSLWLCLCRKVPPNTDFGQTSEAAGLMICNKKEKFLVITKGKLLHYFKKKKVYKNILLHINHQWLQFIYLIFSSTVMAMNTQDRGIIGCKVYIYAAFKNPSVYINRRDVKQS